MNLVLFLGLRISVSIGYIHGERGRDKTEVGHVIAYFI